jgi:hypothetical protein
MKTMQQTHDAVGGVFRILWTGVRLPLLGVLTLLEGTVQAVLGGAAFLIFWTALFFEYATRVAHFPFWPMLTLSGGCVVALILYYALLRVLSE